MAGKSEFVSWDFILDLILDLYKEKSDDFVVSIGNFDKDTIPQVFNARIGMTIRELKECIKMREKKEF